MMNILKFGFYFCLVFCSFAVSSKLFAEETAKNLRFEFVEHDEDSFFGSIVSLDSEKILLREGDQEKTVALDQLEAIRNCLNNPYFIADSPKISTSPKSPSNTRKRSSSGNPRLLKPSALSASQDGKKGFDSLSKWKFPDSVCVLELADGSRLVAESVVSEGQNIKVDLLNVSQNQPKAAAVVLPVSAVDSIRFNVKTLDDVLDPPSSWKRIVSAKDGKGDRLVVGEGEKLDLYSGVLVNLSKETISFSVEGETLPVPRRRIFGLQLHQAAKEKASSDNNEKAASLGTLSLWDGTRIVFQTISGAENETVNWTSVSGVSGVSAFQEIDHIQFGQSDAVFLSDLPIQALSQTVPFQWEKATGETSSIKLFETFRTNRINVARKEKMQDGLDLLALNSRKPTGDKRSTMLFNQPVPDLSGICFDGVVHTKGMMIPMGTTLEWNLSEPYTGLKGIVGFDDRFRPEGRAKMMILSGESLLWEQVVSGKDKARQLKIDLPSPVRSLTVRVESLDGLADTIPLGIADFKLIK